jgi:hypothetical protein
VPGPDTAPPLPVWNPETLTTPKLATALERPLEVAPPRIPNWERISASTTWAESRWQHATKTTLPPQGTRSGPDADERRPRRGRLFTPAIAIGLLALVFIAGAVILASLHHGPKATAGRPAALTSSTSASDVARLLAATKAAEGADTAAQAKLHALSGFPTPTNVAEVINPYVTSLQRYKTALVDTPVPESARTLADNARALVSLDVQFLGTINGLPPLRLGSYLEEFTTGADALQTTLGNLQGKLISPRR